MRHATTPHECSIVLTHFMYTYCIIIAEQACPSDTDHSRALVYHEFFIARSLGVYCSLEPSRYIRCIEQEHLFARYLVYTI